MNALRFAVGTLTAFPVRPPSSVEPPTPGRAMVLAPAVGLLLGGLGGSVAGLGSLAGWSPLVQSTLAISTLALATRGLHLDGLADCADGLAASYDRERALAVMRRGDVGPAGVATTVLVLLLQAGALAETPRPWLAMAVAAIAGRLAVPIACRTRVPAARSDGLGAAVAGSVRPALVAGVVVLVAAAAAGAFLLAGEPWWRGGSAVLAAAVAAALVVHRAVTRFGGVTGDVIGAAVELATTAAVLTLAY